MEQLMVAGEAAWRRLIGHRVRFELTLPWEDWPEVFEGAVLDVVTWADDPRYPWIGIELDTGGVSVRADEAVRVEVLSVIKS